MTAPDAIRRHHRACNLCEAMCGLVVEHDGRRVLGLDGDPDDPLSRGHLCTKAQALAEVYEDPDRLRRPQRREVDGQGGDRWREVGWEAALDEAADRLATVAAEHGRDSVALYVGNPTVHDYGAMIGSSLLGAALGTANRYSATSVDQLPRHFVSRLLYGHQGLLPVPDVDRTDFFLIVGANPLASNGSLMSAPGIGRRLKAIQERGGRVVVLDPRRTETAARADRHLFVRPGTDALLLAAMLQLLFAEDRVRPGRLGDRLDDLDELAAIARRFPPERVAPATGVPAEEIRRLARELSDSPAAAPYGRVGACTQRFGGLTTWLLDCLALVTGNLDRPGGLMFPRPAVDLAHRRFGVGRGEIGGRRSRVRGLASFDGQFPAVALAEEIDTPASSSGRGRGRSQVRGPVRALVTLAGNPVLSLPDGRRLERALGGLDSMVSIDLYRNETTRYADLILPPAHALEQDHYDLALHLVAVRNTARYSPALFPPDPGTRTSWQVLSALAERLDRRRGGAAALAAAVKHRLFALLGPRGILDLGLRLGPYGRGLAPFARGLDLATLEATPHGVDLGPLGPRLPDLLQTPDRRIPLVPPELAADLPRLEAALEESADGLVLIGRRHVKDNNSWLHNVPRLMRGPDRSTLWLHPDDAAARGLTPGDRARLTTRTGTAEATVHVTDRIMPGVASLPHGYGHNRPGTRLTTANRHPGTPLNDLTDTTLYDHLTGNAALNGTPVTIEPAPNPASRPTPTTPQQARRSGSVSPPSGAALSQRTASSPEGTPDHARSEEQARVPPTSKQKSAGAPEGGDTEPDRSPNPAALSQRTASLPEATTVHARSEEQARVSPASKQKSAGAPEGGDTEPDRPYPS